MSTTHTGRRAALRLSPIAAGLASLFVLAHSLSAAPVAASPTRPFDGSLMKRGLSAGLLPNRFAEQVRTTNAAAPGNPSMIASVVTSCGDDADDFTTLRHAVLTANNGDKIDLSGLQCSKITLTSGAIAVTLDDLTIEGRDAAALTIDGNQSDRVFKHTGAGTLTLSRLTVANGLRSDDKAYGGCIYSKGNLAMKSATLTACKALGQAAAVGGGAVVFGTLSMDSSAILSNLAEATLGGGSKQTSAIGGGAVALSQTSQSTITGSLISGNVAQSPTGVVEGGGLIANQLSAKYSTFNGNSAIGGGTADNYSGAGAFLPMESLFMLNCTVDHNTADLGGGMFLANNGYATILQSTISSNKGNLGIGGIAADVTFSMANSTVAFNTGGPFGGGGLVLADTYTANLQSNILADNVPTDFDGGLTITGSDNLVKVAGPNAGMLPAGTITLDPMLLPLAFNGGTLRTHALSPNSPARDAGNNTINLGSDERGGAYARVIGSAADIGAVEFDSDRIFSDGLGAP